MSRRTAALLIGALLVNHNLAAGFPPTAADLRSLRTRGNEGSNPRGDDAGSPEEGSGKEGSGKEGPREEGPREEGPREEGPRENGIALLGRGWCYAPALFLRP